MPREINKFSNGGKIEFDTGSFDHWCVFVTKPDGERFAPTDVQYFTRLQKLGRIHGFHKIYDDFVAVYNRTTVEINSDVFELIKIVSKFYQSDALEIEIWFNVLYAGMIAEENKKNAILKKRIKRLGMFQVLIDKMDPELAATFSKGKKWRELDAVMRSNGF